MTGHAEMCSLCRKRAVYTVSALRNKTNGTSDWIEICGDCLFKHRKLVLTSKTKHKTNQARRMLDK